ncbi:unnamed protein product (macronuclear) [Paramecium tetraurelia]|uniref:Uncharacterized protein n=1 Tax=Paramecium tetraurelia TaxID=5888 RepID=A0D2C4_PARTE|nr:uncharacterized protein GSPATT00012697001 [Paramecium tetraurelia]CAK77191.1 unnamed protein product [Paramecium tetraurelia]|eukprot:XP_001444588.1 hypothetical protein (macronuclear) [Paramecium tetraurelia strain d4-2]
MDNRLRQQSAMTYLEYLTYHNKEPDSPRIQQQHFQKEQSKGKSSRAIIRSRIESYLGEIEEKVSCIELQSYQNMFQTLIIKFIQLNKVNKK